MTGSSTDLRVLGLDVGAVSVAVAVLDFDGSVLRTFYALHHGDIEQTLDTMMGELLGAGAADAAGDQPAPIHALACTTSTPALVCADRRFDNQICLIAAARRYHPDARSILAVGGERFGLVRLDQDGEYLSFRANPMCAAGTGGFLDQQARRLNLPDVGALAELALANREPPARIASRCAVFAKTDLVHAQQEGHSLEAICDGLCRGLAKNIVDTAFTGEPVGGPLLVVGGVAKNLAVVGHLRDLLGVDVVADGELPHGAAGAALKLLLEGEGSRATGRLTRADVLRTQSAERSYEYEPLELRLSEYPDFSSLDGYLFHGQVVHHSHPVEVDVYRELDPSGEHSVHLGIDIGSTSTKAVVTDASTDALPDASPGGSEGPQDTSSVGGCDPASGCTPDRAQDQVLAGFYTATAGRPLEAVQLILEAITDWTRRRNLSLHIRGVATTGAGRKLVGSVLGADLVLDEITAHARAAVELHPDVDTILEIGGQDSKFTTLRSGRVTLSVMNNVCAAGTGSFIEEQAKRLEVPLDEYHTRTRGLRSPMASERCTVFMERDLNHYLSEGHAPGEVLAAVLHSVRENYLNKVAVESAIGERVVFQGATARNEALVAAFEQRLQKPILVSRYCHLTGALGAALTLRDEGIRTSGFRGLELHRTPIPVRSETCELCTNHCRLSVAEVAGDTVAYGFLCGRDYHTRKHVKNNTSGFDLLKTRRRAFAVGPVADARPDFTVGLPASLHLFEDVPFWKSFFGRLGIRTVSSERYATAVKDGRPLAGSELCAPLTALHAHVRWLLDKADVVFLPFYFEKKSDDKALRRQLCYYTQFAPTLGAAVGGADDAARVLTPMVHHLYSTFFSKAELYRSLQAVVPGGVSFLDVSRAFDEAIEAKEEGLARLRQVYRDRGLRRGVSTGESAADDHGFHVVLLGRPYTVLSPWMNKRIPDVFASMGVPVFFQDMVDYTDDDVAAIRPILEDIHWHYAAKILETAEVVARTPGAYPVLVTSFKCSPDAFAADYFRRIVEAHGKPYLILQLDEHDSRLGYETRIEAAVRAFRGHHGSEERGAETPTLAEAVALAETSASGPAPIWPPHQRPDLADKILLFPPWDSLSLRLVVAALRKRGLDARLMEESEGSIRRSLRHNAGQCVPLNIVAQDFMEYVERNDLDPSRTVLWTAASSIACNLPLFSRHIRTILEAHGRGFERAEVYAGALSFLDISPTLPVDAYLGYMFGGFMRRMGCRVRPYEAHPGTTDRVLASGMDRLVEVFGSDGDKEEGLAEVVSRLQSVELADGPMRPEVALFGDFYSRDNEVLNQGLIRFIEAHGGEVITTPFTSLAKMAVRPYYWKWFLEGKYMNVLSTGAFMTALGQLEKKYLRIFQEVLGEGEPAYDASPQAILSEYNVRLEHTGESMENLLKIFYTVRHHPDVALFVQASPAFCCPSLVTEAMAPEIQRITGVPVVSVTYDGTGGSKNGVILPYLEFPRARGGTGRRLRTA